MKTSIYRVIATVPRYAEAATIVRNPGDCAIVERGGVRRQLVMCCPDGCGEMLSVNLDARSGPAWRLYKKRATWSLFPSIDKTSGCRSHFILWNGRILWCDFDEGEHSHGLVEIEPDRILKALQTGRIANFVEIADELDEVPWDVLTACRSLARQGVLAEGIGKERGVFRVEPSSK